MIILIGKTCSGKDTILNKLVKNYGYSKLITYTTRSKRKGEVQDKTYHFISEEEFLSKIDSEFFLEYRKYETADGIWYYGSAKEDYEKADDKTVVILTPRGFSALKLWTSRNNIKLDINPLYIYANIQTIRDRLKKRGDKKEEAERRIKADNADFDGVLEMTDRIFYNNERDNVDDVVEAIHDYIEWRKDNKD